MDPNKARHFDMDPKLFAKVTSRGVATKLEQQSMEKMTFNTFNLSTKIKVCKSGT